MPKARRPRVLVLGTGFAGVKAARLMAAKADVALVAPDERFTFRPLIHELISEESKPTQLIRPPRTREIEYVRAAAQRIDGQHVITRDGDRLRFDRLLVAVGARPNFFGVPGAQENALPVWTMRQALKANVALKQLLLAAPVVDRPARVVVVGAGATGLEVATETAAFCQRYTLPYQVDVIEMRDTLFPQLPAAFRREVRHRLKEFNLHVRFNTRVLRVAADGVDVESASGGKQWLAADLVLWCAGIQANPIDPLTMRVDWTLKSTDRDNVWIAGDCAVFPTPVAQLAQTAEAQGEVAAHNILKPNKPRTYEPTIKGTIVSLGPGYAVAEVAAGKVLSGKVPWHVKKQYYKWTQRGY